MRDCLKYNANDVHTINFIESIHAWNSPEMRKEKKLKLIFIWKLFKCNLRWRA